MGSGTTSRLGLEYPLTSDPTNIPGDMQTLATQLSTGISPSFAGAVVFLANPTSGMPSAGVSGRLFYATDTGTLYWDNGTAWQAFNAASIVTTKGDILLASGAGVLARLGVGSDGAVFTSRSTATNGGDWELPPAQQVKTLTAHSGIAAGSTASSGNLTIPTGGAGTWAIKSKVPVVGASSPPAGATEELVVNGSNYQTIFSVLQPSTNNGIFELNVDIAGMTAGETISLTWSNPSGSGQTMTFAAADSQGDGGACWFTATWLHA